MKKRVLFWTLTVIVLVSVILGISSEQNVEVWGWICGVSCSILAIYTTILLWNKWPSDLIWRPAVGLVYPIVVVNFEDVHFLKTVGMQWTGWGLAALIFLVMGTCGFLDCHRMMTECPEQEEDKDSEEVIDELWRWVSLFLGGIYFMFLAVFFLGVGRLLPLSLNTLGIMATFVIIVPGPLLIAYFSGSIFGSSHAKTENHDPEPYDGFAEEHCPGFDEFEADDDDFVDDDFEGREAEEE